MDFFFFLNLNLYSTAHTMWHRGGRRVVPVLRLDMYGYEKRIAVHDLCVVGLLNGSPVYVFYVDAASSYKSPKHLILTNCCI